MKIALLFVLALTGCATVYKVDSKGICRAPDGKIVKEAKIDPDRHIYNGPRYVHQRDIVNGGSWWGQQGTAYGW